MLNNHIVDPVSVSISVDEWFNFLVSIRSAQSASNFSFFVFLSAVLVAGSKFRLSAKASATAGVFVIFFYLLFDLSTFFWFLVSISED